MIDNLKHSYLLLMYEIKDLDNVLFVAFLQPDRQFLYKAFVICIHIFTWNFNLRYKVPKYQKGDAKVTEMLTVIH